MLDDIYTSLSTSSLRQIALKLGVLLYHQQQCEKHATYCQQCIRADGRHFEYL
jgi:hypothetical protein